MSGNGEATGWDFPSCRVPSGRQNMTESSEHEATVARTMSRDARARPHARTMSFQLCMVGASSYGMVLSVMGREQMFSPYVCRKCQFHDTGGVGMCPRLVCVSLSPMGDSRRNGCLLPCVVGSLFPRQDRRRMGLPALPYG